MLESDFVSSRAEICGINANWEIQMDSSSFFYCCEIQESAFKTSYSCAWISPISLQTRFESLLTCKQLFPRGLCEEMHQWCRKNIAEHLFFSECQQAVCNLVFCQQGHKAHIFMCYKVSENAVLCETVGNYFPLLRVEGSFLSGSPGLAHQNPESDKPLGGPTVSFSLLTSPLFLFISVAAHRYSDTATCLLWNKPNPRN